MTKLQRKDKRIQRQRRIRAKISGTAERPRLSVFRSHKHLYVQLIDDTNGRVIGVASDAKIKSKQKKEETIKQVAQSIAKKAREEKIESIVFDRGGYTYHGQIKVLADELRSQGMKF